MALSAKLQMRQAQSLVMTPQLLQSIRLLQMNRAELETFLDTEIERNPLLEREGDDGGEDAGTQAAEPDGRTTSETISGKLDASLENLFPDDPGTQDSIGPDLSAQWKSAGGNGLATSSGSDYNLENVAAAERTLHGHVEEQIALTFRDATARLIARELAGGLDDAGYMLADMKEIATRIGADRALVEETLTTCQTFEPAGLFARNLCECLTLQLQARDRYDPAMRAMVDNLDLLAKRDFKALERLCGVDSEDLLDMLAEIRTLDPKPGTAFSRGGADTVIPDIIVKAAGDGGWAVELNADALPRVLVNEAYFATVSAHSSQDDRNFLSECLQNANWLTRALDQRAKTILKVASEIIRQQDAFLLHGVRQLRPLNLRMVAEAIGMHESTISRVTANKFMMTPRGNFELRYFFTTALASATGEDTHSSESVRARIRQLIDEETVDAILSDEALVDILRGEKIDIARRTVAKYREGLNIPSSVQRRREKRVKAGKPKKTRTPQGSAPATFD